jgi:uncharacterized protein YecE (DUF72 family)
LVYIGTAGWNIPKLLSEDFLGDGTHLERYARVFNCVEINSSFYRDHKPETYEKWAKLTPDNFRFSVKLSRYFTQEARLKDTSSRLNDTLASITSLKHKWATLLIQLPPSLIFDYKVATNFFDRLRSVCSISIVLEPRHISWASDQAASLLVDYQIGRVLANPEPVCIAPEQYKHLTEKLYYRLHGFPELYKSSYSAKFIENLRDDISKNSKRNVWCIFNNTTLGFATENALELLGKV